MTQSPNQEKTRVKQPAPSDQINSAKYAHSPSTLGAALLQLPQQYFKAIVKPSVATYTDNKAKASWGLVWIQLLAWAILDAALGVLVNLLYPPATGSSFSRVFAFATSYGLVIVVPTLFFLLMGIVYWLAKSFGGQGTFLELCHTSLTIQAPLGILSKLLALIPGIGKILNSILSLYGIILQVVVIMAVHRLSRGKAIATILLPLVTVGVLAGVIYFLITR
jgi:hypothetical protein